MCAYGRTSSAYVTQIGVELSEVAFTNARMKTGPKLDGDPAFEASPRKGASQHLAESPGVDGSIPTRQGSSSVDGIWTSRVGPRYDHGKRSTYSFPANTDAKTKVENLFAAPVQAQYIRIYPETWTGNRPNMRSGLLLTEEDPTLPPTESPTSSPSVSPTMFPTLSPTIGMTEWNPDNNAYWRTYDSVYRNDDYGNIYNRGQLDSTSAWVASSNTIGETWYQIDAQSIISIVGVVTQGNAQQSRYVSTFKFKWSTDGIAWTAVDDGRTFEGNSDRNTKKLSVFDNIVEAQHIRLYPQSWYPGWAKPQLRCGLLVNGGLPTLQLSEWNAPNTAEWRSYSSVLQNVDYGYGLNQGELDSPSAWTGGTKSWGEWYQITTQSLRIIAGVVTQGSARAGPLRIVEEFTCTWSDYGAEYHHVDDAAVFSGNSDKNTRVNTTFTTPVRAQYIRIFPEVWTKSYPSMRSGLILTGTSPTTSTTRFTQATTLPGTVERHSSPSNNTAATGAAVVTRGKVRRSRVINPPT
jgi:hypothetical protein